MKFILPLLLFYNYYYSQEIRVGFFLFGDTTRAHFNSNTDNFKLKGNFYCLNKNNRLTPIKYDSIVTFDKTRNDEFGYPFELKSSLNRSIIIKKCNNCWETNILVQFSITLSRLKYSRITFEELIKKNKKIIDLLKSKENGVLIEYAEGDIWSLRLSNGSAYKIYHLIVMYQDYEYLQSIHIIQKDDSNLRYVRLY